MAGVKTGDCGGSSGGRLRAQGAPAASGRGVGAMPLSGAVPTRESCAWVGRWREAVEGDTGVHGHGQGHGHSHGYSHSQLKPRP